MTKKGCCVVPHCRNSSEKTASSDAIYQKFPTKDKIRRRWIKAIQNTFKSFSADPSSTPRLCSDHFDETCFLTNKNNKKIFKLEAVPTIFDGNAPKKQQQQQLPEQQAEVAGRSRHQSRRAASKEALKQMQILLEDEDDTVEIPDDEDEVVPVVPVVSPPKKKYKLTHRKSSDGHDREVLVLKSITPNVITNHYVENNLELECWVEELEPCQKERIKKMQEEEEALQNKLDELIKACKGEIIYKGDLTTVIEVSDHVQKTIQAVQASHNKPPIVLNNTVATPTPGYQLMMDPRLGLIVGSVPPTPPAQPKQGKIQVATNLQAPPVATPTQNTTVRSTPTQNTAVRSSPTQNTAVRSSPSQNTAVRSRGLRTRKPLTLPSPSPAPQRPTTPSTIGTRSVLASKPANKKATPQVSVPSPPATRSVPTPPATRSRGTELPTSTPPAPTPPVTRSREIAAPTPPAPTPPVTRSRPGAVVTNARPTENNVEGGLSTGSSLKPKAIVDLTGDDGRPLPDSREVSFNKLQGKTFPSLVVVARPHLRVTDINIERAKLDSKVKSVLMFAPTKFTEWYLSTGLSFRNLATTIRMGVSTLSYIINNTCIAIWEELVDEFMPTPSQEQLENIAEDYRKTWKFPNCIGAIDGKHCQIKCPSGSGSTYFNYMKYFSILLQGVADANKKFIAIEVGARGKQCDGGVFASSTLFNLIESNNFNIPPPKELPNNNNKVPHVLIGYEAYPLKSYLMRPYPIS